jgi:hypothetical protein|tara:strand:- start:1052 stop:1276 length:225 start_codon:yes stop_codon:yes gene_type:complete
MSEKRDNFIRIAEKRVCNAIHDLYLIKKMANRALYEWDDDQIDQILRALKSEIKGIENSFNSKEKAKDQQFKFK